MHPLKGFGTAVELIEKFAKKRSFFDKNQAAFRSPRGFFVFFFTQVAISVMNANQDVPRSKMGR